MIGFFDSGVGGLSILRVVQRMMPKISTVYFGDTKNFPYGTKTEDQVRQCSLRAVEVLMKYKPSAIVVACNTASTSAISSIREHVPHIPVIGVVPALKPAVSMTKTKNIAVLATERTLESKSYQELKKTFDGQVTIIDQACPGWVDAVESCKIKDGGLDNTVERLKINDGDTEERVREVIQPLVGREVDTFVLGCTHYPFLRPLIERYAGTSAQILDSGEAVARQLQRVVGKNIDDEPRPEIFLTSGDPEHFAAQASALLHRKVMVG